MQFSARNLRFKTSLKNFFYQLIESVEKLKNFLTPPQFGKSQPALSPRPCLAFTSFASDTENSQNCIFWNYSVSS